MQLNKSQKNKSGLEMINCAIELTRHWYLCSQLLQTTVLYLILWDCCFEDLCENLLNENPKSESGLVHKFVKSQMSKKAMKKN
jgi:hypothetical protein